VTDYGGLGVVLSWAALAAGVADWLKPPSFLVGMFGRRLAELLHALGCLVLLRSLAIGMAWIPFRRNKRMPRREG
jgi:hypothetical protein